MFVPVIDKAVDDLFTESMWDTYIKDNLNKGVVRPIAEATLGSSAASIDITSIAADWSHLFLIVYARGDTAAINANVLARFNADTGANYDGQQLYGSGATPNAAESLGATSALAGQMPANSATANRFGSMGILIPHYANSATHKTLVSMAGLVWGTATGTLRAMLTCGVWRSAAAITQVTLLPSAGNFVTGTRATLYGMGGI